VYRRLHQDASKLPNGDAMSAAVSVLGSSAPPCLVLLAAGVSMQVRSRIRFKLMAQFGADKRHLS